jgi:hypothetical protein
VPHLIYFRGGRTSASSRCRCRLIGFAFAVGVGPLLPSSVGVAAAGRDRNSVSSLRYSDLPGHEFCYPRYQYPLYVGLLWRGCDSLRNCHSSQRSDASRYSPHSQPAIIMEIPEFGSYRREWQHRASSDTEYHNCPFVVLGGISSLHSSVYASFPVRFQKNCCISESPKSNQIASSKKMPNLPTFSAPIRRHASQPAEQLVKRLQNVCVAPEGVPGGSPPRENNVNK